MTQVIRKPAWREKTKVLCFFEYVGREQNTTKRLTDSVMISVEFADQIKAEFELAMRDIVRRWNFHQPGPRPLEWKLLKYMTASGKRTF